MRLTVIYMKYQEWALTAMSIEYLVRDFETELYVSIELDFGYFF